MYIYSISSPFVLLRGSRCAAAKPINDQHKDSKAQIWAYSQSRRGCIYMYDPEAWKHSEREQVGDTSDASNGCVKLMLALFFKHSEEEVGMQYQGSTK